MSEQTNETKTITPAEYFEKVKSLKNQNTVESLDSFYDAAVALMRKYKIFNQKKMVEKLMFIIECVPKEKALLELGVNTYINKESIEDFINTVEGKAVKVIDMESYPRDIPEELIDIVEKTQNIY